LQPGCGSADKKNAPQSRLRTRGDEVKRIIEWICAAALALIAATAIGQTYPTKPIRMIMPNAPGSANDTLGRIVAAHLGEALGQQIVIDNRAGAGGLLGMEIGKNSAPDGYTLAAASTAAMSIAPHIYKSLPYDPLRDFEYISLYAATPNVLVVNPNTPAKNMKEWIDWMKANGKSLNMASAGAGSQSHLTGVALLADAGLQSTHVPYKGGGASVAAVVAGESQWTITPAPAVMGLIKSGRLRALAQSLPQRTPLLPDVPSVKEFIPKFDYSGWNGLLAPKGTPRPILVKLRNTLIEVTKKLQFIEQFAAQGAQVVTDTPEEFREFVRREIESSGAVVRAAGLKVE
jgi:tripartite-type tricarboxylate transporter receptor subunit TctC